MRRRLGLSLGLALTALGAGNCRRAAPPPPAPPRAAPAPEPPLTPPQRLLAQVAIANGCLWCHNEDLIVATRLDRPHWEEIIRQMERWGAGLEPSVRPLVVRYLGETHSATAAVPSPGLVDAEALAAALEPLPDGKLGGGVAGKGATLYDKTCARCHGAGAVGGPQGPALRRRPILTRAADFATALTTGRRGMAPAPTLAPGAIADLLAYLRQQSRPGAPGVIPRQTAVPRAAAPGPIVAGPPTRAPVRMRDASGPGTPRGPGATWPARAPAP